MNNLTYSDNGLSLTRQFEGLSLHAYDDPVGVLTIGYGHTGADVTPGLVWTQQQADAALLKDSQWAVAAVNKNVLYPLNQNQFDALVDFVFNLGETKFKTSTLLRLLNVGNFIAASAEFPKWNKQKLKGITFRRIAEETLFNKPV